mgnify:FL=1
MTRYEISFVIKADLEDAGMQPWWLLIGEKTMPVEWLEYIKVRDMDDDEDVLDGELDPETINIVDMVRRIKKKPQLKLVVNNEAKDDEQTHEDV